MKQKHKKFSNKQYFIILVVIFFLLMGINSWATVLSVRTGKKLVNEYVDETSQLYVDNINKELYRINQELVYTMDTYEDLKKIPTSVSSKDTLFYETQWKIERHNREQESCYDAMELMFVYGIRADILITDQGVVFDPSTAGSLNRMIMYYLAEAQDRSVKATRWDVIRTEEGAPYMIGFYQSGDVILGCVLDPIKFLSELELAADNYEIVPYILTDRNEIIKASKYEEQYIHEIQAGKVAVNRITIYPLRFVGDVYINVLNTSGIKDVMESLQVILLILMLLGFGLIMLALVMYVQRILRPMERFVSGLEELSVESNLHDDETQNLLELQAANQHFKELLKRIQALRIEVYEKELNEQRIELEFAQEQIRPHFFLNCLSLIHGIADERGENDIKNISETMSEYIRYIFQRSKTMRTVKEEMIHVESYIKIQRIRYGDQAFCFETMMEPEVEELPIPYLLLQPLVENAIVHEVSLDKLIEISVYITKETLQEQDYLYISVSDTGAGFKQEVLEKFEKDEPVYYNGRAHIGLLNIKKRIQLIYGGQGQMSISNMDEDFGAIVEIRIPLQYKQQIAMNEDMDPYQK